MRPFLSLSILLISVVATAQNFSFLGEYTSDGTPLYLEAPDDVVTSETLSLVASALPESYPVPTYNPHYISSDYDTDVIVHEDAEVYVTFVAEGAGYKNVLGFYTYDINNPLDQKPTDKDITIIFPNVSAQGSGGGLKAGNKVKLGSFKAGTGIGWVLLANAWKSEVTWGLWQLYSNPDFNPEADPALRYHNVLLNDPENERIILGFEDIRRDYSSCDQDFNDALFYISANPYTALETKNYADVASATKVNSAYDGGLESNGDLSTLIAKRNLNRSKTNDQKNTKAAQSRFKKSKFPSKNGTSNLASYFGETALFGTETAAVASPSDLQDITNASGIFAIDYYQGEDRVVAGLLLKTEDRVYDHAKTICDRLNGATLDDIRRFQLRGHQFILAEILRANGLKEYAVSFSVNQSDAAQTLYSYWNIDQYPEGDYLNFQFWGTSVAQVSSLINYALDVLEQSGGLNSDPNTTYKLPEVFVKSGYYSRGALVLNLCNKTGVKTLVAETNKRATETDSLENTVQNLSLSGAYEEQVILETGYLFDVGVSLTDAQTGSYDALYLADGPWGIDYNQTEANLTDFIIDQAVEVAEGDAYSIERNVSLNAEVKGTFNIFRHILAGELALDVRDLSALEFELETNVPVEVILVPANLEDWSNRLRYTLPASQENQFYAIPFDEFKNASGEAQSVTAIRSVVFSVQGDYINFQSAAVRLKNLAFSNNRSLSVEAIAQELQSTQVHNYPNPFTQYTLIKLPAPAVEAAIELVDMNGRQVVSKKRKTSGNQNTLRLDRDGLPTGLYSYAVTTDTGSIYNGKLLIN